MRDIIVTLRQILHPMLKLAQTQQSSLNTLQHMMEVGTKHFMLVQMLLS
ncbi:hypothetical protein BPOR_0737g00060 [Botrytis porri]|uniref:Uncharacterized protein n=1 Tax=Botrytis porri TaxID=87229 RepID=A0A4Z1K9Z3_9HELO|nr:hypothetical protein BPOR_0737g00060 [Botrytis porri]